MKILVTGGAGFIGSHVVDAYIDAGHEVVVVDNFMSGNKKNINPKAILLTGDITANDFIQVFKDKIGFVDIINHHAAQVNLRRSLHDPFSDAKINILGTLNILQLAHIFHIKKFIFISSGGAIYGHAPLPTKETFPPTPISPYGLSKYVGERYVQLYHELYNLPYIILRYANVYGPKQNPKGEAGVISIFIDKMLNNQQPTIFGDGEQTRDYVYVKDVAIANVLALTKGENTIINIGTGKKTSVTSIFSLLKKQTGFQKSFLSCEEIIGEIRDSFLDITKAKDILNWESKIYLEQGLQLTIDYTMEIK